MATARELVDDLLHTEDSRRRFEALKPKYALYRELVEARRKAKLTQHEIAERMGTSISSVSRLEKGETTPSLRSLERYAAALGHHLEIRLVPDERSAEEKSKPDHPQSMRASA